MKRHVLRMTISLALVLSLIFTSGSLVFAEPGESREPVIPNLQEHFVNTQDSYDFVDPNGLEALLNEAESFPETYDMRELGYITPIRFQNPFGSCWAFSAVAAAESSILSSGLAEEGGYDQSNLDLSEKHLSLFTLTAIQDPDSPQYGEGFKFSDVSASEKMNNGGNPFLSSNVFASGAGPVLEIVDPSLLYRGRYGNIDYRFFDGALQPFCYSDTDDWSVDYGLRNCQSYSLKESYMLPTPADVIDPGKGMAYWEYSYNPAGTAAIKKQLLAGRAVEIGFLADQASPNQDEVEPQLLSKHWAHYGTYMKIANHAVTIVGWDDNYPVENFIQPPQGPGAWLVKNSWGSGMEEFPNKGEGSWGIEDEETGKGTGYFWLSYYDHSISTVEALEFERAEEDRIMNAHDYMPAMDMYATEYQDETRMANIFQADHNEELTQIAFYTTHPDTQVEWAVYLLENNYDSPETGILKAEGTASYEFGGFHKVDLGDQAFPILANQYFTVVIREILPDGTDTVNIPVQIANNFNSVINDCESKVFLDGTWKNLIDENVQLQLIAGLNPEEVTSMDDSEYIVDNFSIKAYGVPLETDLAISISGVTKSLKFLDKKDHVRLKIRPTNYGTDESMKETGVWNIKWGQYPTDRDSDEDLFVLEPSEDGFSVEVTARKIDGQCLTGHAWVYAEVYAESGAHIGTALTLVSASKATMEGIQLNDLTEVFVYNGTEFCPEVTVTAFGNPAYILEEDVDYKLDYKDNIKCGAAQVIATAMGDVEEGTVTAYFPILPPKASLLSLKEGIRSVTVNLEDLKESGISGYEVGYREEGTEEWQTEQFPADSPEVTVTGLSGGKKYEICARGYVENDESLEKYGIDTICYGDYSNVLTTKEIPAPAYSEGWNLIDGKWYYFDEDGNAQKGWLLDNDKWYYLDTETGAMATGWILVNDVWYFLYGNGEMAANAWWDGYWLNADGSWTYLPRGSWKQNAQGWWYGDTSGWYCANGSYMINGILQSFNAAGYWIF